MYEMTKSFFQVIKSSGHKYVVKSDELQKNHGAFDKEAFSGFMPENPEWDLCPVRSFELYIQKLSPEKENLWQRPRNQFPQDPNTPW